jgi:ABC-type transporter Mla MlaB component
MVERRDQSSVVTRPSRVRSSSFKYYIHDGTDACRLQLLGELTEADVPELSGCWRTAKTCLGNRKLLLDVRGLKSIDDAGSEWLVSMAAEGASFVPESFLRTGLPAHAPEPPKNNAGNGLVSRVLSFLRGARVAAAE